VISNAAGGAHTQAARSPIPASVIAAATTIPNLPAITLDRGPSTRTQRAALQVLIDLGTPVLDGLLTEPARATRTATGTVTVFIPAHNEAASIGATLRSLREQTLSPAHVVVVCDNCTDDTASIAAQHGVTVFPTVGNTARKAGALNQALSHFLPILDGNDLVLLMDADSQLSTNWIASAAEALQSDRKLGGVCGTYLGLNEGGLLKQLQRNEFVRASRLVPRREALWVLSGTGTMFRARVLREIGRERGSKLPGTRGEFYNSRSITEDYEITLALKTLGWRCIAPPGCMASTEIMPTWLFLFRQRLRWQTGTLTALRNYGVTRITWTNWAKQVFFYARYFAQVACWVIIGSSLYRHPSLYMPTWVIVMLSIIYVERIITVRKAGIKGILLAALLFPEWGYGMFDGLYLMRALISEMTGGDVSWGHLGSDDA
jgi:cellulose synthase/poly-beta-1,6-N-acetylglucosamine synthase-like glycosyltransferase